MTAAALLSASALLVLAPTIASVVGAAAPVPLTIRLVRLAAVVHVLDALQAVLGFALRGLGDARVPAVLTAVGYGVIGPATVACLLIAGLGPEAIWLGLVSGLTVTVVGFGLRWRQVVLRRDAADP